MSQVKLCPSGHLSVLCWLFLLYERVEESIYGFRVQGVEVADDAKVTKMAEKAKGSKGIQMTARHVIWPVAEKGVQMTARHVICLVAEMAGVSVMTTRYVMCSLGEVAV
jgi:hypothetical protein